MLCLTGSETTVAIKRNENNRRVGESNPAAKLTDREVELMQGMLAERTADGKRAYSLRQIAAFFEVSYWCVKDISRGKRRCQVGYL